MTRDVPNGGLRVLAERILSNKAAPPVLVLAAWKLLYRRETRPLRDLVEEAGRGLQWRYGTVIPVEQRYSFDCVQACLASIFEVPYEAAPVLWEPDSDTHRADWLFILNHWLRERGFGLQNFHRREGDNPQKSPWHFVGYWVGGVWSPRFTEPDGSPGAHAVVMRGSDLVWDPNPRREMGHLGFYCADVLMPLDPARFGAAEIALRMIIDGPAEDRLGGYAWAAGVATSALASMEERSAA